MDLVNESDIIYLVDLENIGSKGLYQHVKQHLNAEYIIFYSDTTTTPGLILDQVAKDLHVTFVDCKTGSNNAMDFCICAMAGRLSINQKKILRILSDDKGYDPMLHILQQQGVCIRRENSSYPQTSNETSPFNINPKQSENIPIIKEIRACVPKKYQDDIIAELPSAVNRKQAHEILQRNLPQKMVPEIHKRLKKFIPKERI